MFGCSLVNNEKHYKASIMEASSNLHFSAADALPGHTGQHRLHLYGIIEH